MSNTEPRYLTSNDATMRMDGGLVRYRGEVYFSRVMDSVVKLFNLYDIGNNINAKAKYVLNYNDPEIDTTAIHIGYINDDNFNTVYYITRPPFRKQKQSTAITNTLYSSLGSMKFNVLPNSIFFSKAVEAALAQQYPSFFTCCDQLRKLKKTALAFSSEFAILHDEKNDNGQLYFEQIPIGTVQLRDPVISLHPHCNDSLLVQRLSELGAPVL